MSRAIVVLLLLLSPVAGAAQDPRDQPAAPLLSVRANPAAHPALTRMIPIALADVSIADALTAVADAAGIGISYSREALPDRRVRLGPANMTAGAALNAILEGTRFEAFVSAGGNVAIAPARAAAATPAQRPPPLVRGRVLDAELSGPLAGVFVVLLDGGGSVRAGVLTDADGHFALRPPAPARYSLRYEMIGYATHTSAEFTVSEAGTIRDDVRLAPAVITLEALRVAAADARCRLTREVGAATYRVWDEARKALSVTAWAERDAGAAYQTVLHEFSRDLVSGEVIPEQPVERRVTSGIGRAPFISASAEELAADGFARQLPDGGYMYYGLDAATLLAAAFLENYCFRVQLPQRDGDAVGLAFEPARARAASDIAGVLWLDRATLGLRRLEYRYTSHPSGVLPLDLFGGRIEFRRLPNGAWIVDEWWIRMPESTTPQALPDQLRRARDARLQVLRAAGLTIREAGGSVRFMDVGESSAAAANGVLRGAVYDSTRMRPLRGAVVFTAGTGSMARTDSDGRFELRGLAPGEHRLGFFHPYTDSLALPIQLTTATLSHDAAAAVSLSVPAAAGCDRDEPGTVQLVGFVIDRAGMPAAGADVLAIRRRAAGADQGAEMHRAAPAAARDSARTTTDDFGRFSLCGVPGSAEVQLHAARSATTVRTPGHGLVRQNLVIR